MFALSFTSSNYGRFTRNRLIKNKVFLIETEKFVYGIANYNLFKPFDREVEKCPTWLDEVYVIKKLGHWLFWKGVK